MDLDIPAGATVILTVAREVAFKDHATLLRTAALLQDAKPPFLFILAGSAGPSSSNIDGLVIELGISEQVRRLGQRNDVAALLAVADIVVSTSQAEGTPGALLEAMAAGRPVVALTAPGVDEVLGADHPGLVTERSAVALAERLLALRTNPSLMAHIRTLGIERHRTDLNMGAYMDRMHQLYRDFAVSPGKGPSWQSTSVDR
jgi:glycosyltransferase involved in cell wall biosynthesis